MPIRNLNHFFAHRILHITFRSRINAHDTILAGMSEPFFQWAKKVARKSDLGLKKPEQIRIIFLNFKTRVRNRILHQKPSANQCSPSHVLRATFGQPCYTVLVSYQNRTFELLELNSIPWP